MKKVYRILLTLSLLASWGCATLPSRTGSTSTGVVINKEKARLDKNKDFDTVWNGTLRTLEEMGTIDAQEKEWGRIESRVGDSRVRANIQKRGEGSTRVEISSQKKLAPDIDLTIEIINTLNQRL